MRWRLVKLLVFLLLGAAVNVAVAWLSAIYIDPETGQYDEFDDYTVPDYRSEFAICRWSVRTGARIMAFGPMCGRDGEITSRQTAPFEELVPCWSAEALGIPERLVAGERPRESLTGWKGYGGLVESRGWPCQALWAGRHVFDSGPSNSQAPGPQYLHAIALTPDFPLGRSLSAGDYRLLPLGIIWRGFALNTLFYAAICWLLIAAPFAYRRWRRVRRGLCPHCKYPVGTSLVCTECGKSVKPGPPAVTRPSC